MKAILSLAALAGAAKALPSEPLVTFPRFDQMKITTEMTSQIEAKIQAAGLPNHITPGVNDKITEWNGLGDSFAAGIGSDSSSQYITDSKDCYRYDLAYPYQMNDNSDVWPGDKPSRKFTHSACSGAVMKEVRDFQLSAQPTSNGANRPYPAFGKPQLSTLTITGNDVGFGNIVSSCILGFPNVKRCTEYLEFAARKIPTDAFLVEMADTFLAVIKAGRAAGGAQPPEKYQLFVNGYVPFWNEVDPGCDNVSWESLGGLCNGLALTRDLRKTLNDLVNVLNQAITVVTKILEPVGVYYVDGWQQGYDKHRFCDPAVDPNLSTPTNAETWFWHYYSPYDKNPPATPETKNATDTQILEYLFPDPVYREFVRQNDAIPAEYETNARYLEVLAAFQDTPQPQGSIFGPTVAIKRIFHPKGAGLTIQANRNVAFVKQSRSSGDIKCTDGTNIKEDDVRKVIDQLRQKGTQQCCSGGVPLVCAPLLAQVGSASVAMCGVANKCIECGQLADLLDPVLAQCFAGDKDTIFQATTTIPEFPGLRAELAFSSS